MPPRPGNNLPVFLTRRLASAEDGCALEIVKLFTYPTLLSPTSQKKRRNLYCFFDAAHYSQSRSLVSPITVSSHRFRVQNRLSPPAKQSNFWALDPRQIPSVVKAAAGCLLLAVPNSESLKPSLGLNPFLPAPLLPWRLNHNRSP